MGRSRIMSDAPKKKTFRKYSYRGVDLENLLVMPMAELMDLVHARARRRFKHGLKRKYYALLKRLRAAKKGVDTGAGEKPDCIKTHLRNMIILPEMIGSVVGVYNGKVFNQVEIKADMVATTSVSSPSPTSLSSTVPPVLVPPSLPASCHSSKLFVDCMSFAMLSHILA